MEGKELKTENTNLSDVPQRKAKKWVKNKRRWKLGAGLACSSSCFNARGMKTKHLTLLILVTSRFYVIIFIYSKILISLHFVIELNSYVYINAMLMNRTFTTASLILDSPVHLLLCFVFVCQEGLEVVVFHFLTGMNMPDCCLST